LEEVAEAEGEADWEPAEAAVELGAGVEVGSAEELLDEAETSFAVAFKVPHCSLVVHVA